MTQVLIVSNWIPGRPSVLADTVRQMHEDGVQVTVVCGCPPEKISIPEGTGRVFGLIAAKQLSSGDRNDYRDAQKSRKLWLRARADRRLRKLAAAADVIVALDVAAVHTVWQLARRNRGADAVVGLVPATQALANRSARRGRHTLRRVLRPGPSPAIAVEQVAESTGRLLEKVARRGAGRRVLRDPRGRLAWRILLDAPVLGDDRRARWSERVADRLLEMNLPEEAGRTRALAARRIRHTDETAEKLAEAAKAEFEAGRIPVFLHEAASAQLELADKALARDDLTEATKRFAKIIPLLFNRAVHFDSLESPSAKDPQGFLAPLHDSAVGQALAASHGRRRPAAPAPADRPQRLLFLTHTNVYFLTDIMARYQEDPRFEVRHLEMTSNDDWAFLSRQTGKLINHQLARTSEYGDALRELFAQQLEWADTVFVDWSLGHAAMLATLDPGTTRVVVRLHSYEAFTVFPHLIDWSRVDDLIFVSEPLREFTMAVAPRLREAGAPRTPVITNAVRLAPYRQAKPADARFTLGLVGLSAIAKDPRWAFQVLRELRKQDERYNLVLVGKEMDGGPNAVAAAYHRKYAADVADLEGRGVLRRVGQTDDVAGALTDVGVILSTSVRESFHLGLIEGAASGAVPVVRNWPFFARQNAGAKSIFPSDWVVDTPEEAARRILTLTANEEIWRKAGEAAAEHAMITWDWSVTQAQYDRLLLPPS